MIAVKDVRMTRQAPLVAMSFSAAALAVALGSQYLAGLKPCDLCLWQRLPHGIVVVAGIGALLWFRSERERRLLTWFAAICFLAGTVLALYHASVEYGIIAAPASCSGSSALNNAESIEELGRLLAQTPPVPCDVAAVTFLGLSMAGWNALLSAVFFWLCVSAGRRQEAQ